MTLSPFRIDVLDALGNPLGSGPLRNVISLNDTQSLDAVGELTFTLPGGDTRVRYFGLGTQFDVYDVADGYLGRYWFRSLSTELSQGRVTFTVECLDALRELSNRSVKFRRNYVYEDVAGVVTDLVSVMGADWTATVDPGIGNTTINYEGESVLIAIDALRDRWGQHYRLGAASPGANVLEFGAFGTDPGVRLIGGTAAPSPELESHRDTAFIQQLREIQDRAEIFNTLIPLGAGEGTTQLTIEAADLGEYDVLTGTNADGSSYFYIQDEASVAQYGVIERVLTIKSVRPLTNSTADVRNAANALKLTAESYLKRRRGLTTHYSLAVQGLRKPLRPGQRVPVRYTGVSDNYAYLDIDTDLWVMDVTRQRRADGQRTAVLAVATDDQRRTADSDLMLDIMNDLTALKVHVPIQLTYRDVGPYTRRIDPANAAPFVVRIKEEVLALNRAILTVRTAPLKSSVMGTDAAAASVGTTGSGGGTTQSTAAGGDHHHKLFDYAGGSGPVNDAFFNAYIERSGMGALLAAMRLQFINTPDANWAYIRTFDASGDHVHSVTIPNHVHSVTIPAHNHTPEYGLYADDQYPRSVHVVIDGVDRTAALGGPWALTNTGINLELTITDELVNASGGLRQNHTIQIECEDGRGEVEVGVEMLCSIQAIAVS